MKKFDKEKLDETIDERKQIENLFTIKRLIKMFEYLDYSDVHGK
jgi:hypothetical protein